MDNLRTKITLLSIYFPDIHEVQFTQFPIPGKKQQSCISQKITHNPLTINTITILSACFCEPCCPFNSFQS